jgi:hypothetical protein
MSLYTIDVAPFKKQHLTYIAISFIPMVISYVMASRGYSIINDPVANEVIKWVFLAATFISSFIVTRKHKQQLLSIHGLPSFYEQVAQYKKIYDQRLVVNVIIGITACILYVLTARKIFILFALFDLIVLLVMYPNKNVFRRELNNNEITFK